MKRKLLSRKRKNPKTHSTRVERRQQKTAMAFEMEQSLHKGKIARCKRQMIQRLNEEGDILDG